MAEWKCPKCKRIHIGSISLVMKICYVCQVQMEVIKYDREGKEISC